MSGPTAPASGIEAPPLEPFVEPFAERCANCGAALWGEFCAQCGQQDRPLDPTAGEMFREAFEEFSTIDGRLLRTLRTLVAEPGQLTVEHVAGRRAAYVAPLKLYLWLSVLFFFLSALVPSRRPMVQLTDFGQSRADSVALARDLELAARRIESDTTSPRPFRRLGAAFKRLPNRQAAFTEAVKPWITRAVFALVPVVAALLAVVYRSRRIRFPRHLFFSFHLHAFVFLALATIAAVNLVHRGALTIWLARLVLLAIPVYTTAALRRVYGGTARGAAARTILLGLLYLPALALAMMLAALVTLLTY